MTPIIALQVLAQAQAVAPLTEAQRNHCYEALNTLRPLVVEAEVVHPDAVPVQAKPPRAAPTEQPDNVGPS